MSAGLWGQTELVPGGRFENERRGAWVRLKS
jgi:hypothetical protein